MRYFLLGSSSTSCHIRHISYVSHVTHVTHKGTTRYTIQRHVKYVMSQVCHVFYDMSHTSCHSRARVMSLTCHTQVTQTGAKRDTHVCESRHTHTSCHTCERVTSHTYHTQRCYTGHSPTSRPEPASKPTKAPFLYIDVFNNGNLLDTHGVQPCACAQEPQSSANEPCTLSYTLHTLFAN